jgi:hypothetical protein
MMAEVRTKTATTTPPTMINDGSTMCSPWRGGRAW